MEQRKTNEESATKFLALATSGKIDEAYQTYVDMSGKHHNTFTPAGFLALQGAMKENDAQFPQKKLLVKHVVSSDDLVAVHSHLTLKPGEPGMIVVHLFRFKQDKIVEMWDCGQVIPIDGHNTDGAF